jgi:hypothetical protein
MHKIYTLEPVTHIKIMRVIDHWQNHILGIFCNGLASVESMLQDSSAAGEKSSMSK